MAHSKKKTVSQKVVAVAAAGLPAPVQGVASSRVGSLLLILAVPLLVATGLLTVTWEDGRPKLKLNRERAAEIEHEAVEKIEEFGEDRHRPDLQERMAELKEAITPHR